MLKNMHVHCQMGIIVVSHPPTASEGIVHMHLDHQPTLLAPISIGHCYDIVETIDVHFKWKTTL